MTITNPPSASSQIELGKSHYLIRSLGIRRLVWGGGGGEEGGGISLWAKLCERTHTDVLFRGHTCECVYVCVAHVASPHQTHQLATSQTKSVIHQSAVCNPPPLQPCVPAGRSPVSVCERASISSEFISGCAEQMARCDMAERFFTGPSAEPASLPLDRDHITDGWSGGARRGRRSS